MLYNTLNGRPFFADTIVVESKNYLGRHFSPGLLLLLPVFWAVPRHETLLVLQALFLSAAGIPVYLACRRLSGSAFIGAALACGYLVAAPLSHTNWDNTYGFQPFSMVVLVVALTLWAAVFERWRLLGVLVFIGLLLEEQYALILLGLGVWLVILLRGRAGQRRWGLGLVLTAVGLVWFICAVFWWMPWFGGGKVAGRYFAYLGNTPIEMLQSLPGALIDALGDWNRWEFMLHLLVPVGLLALLAPEVLGVGAPLLMVILLADDEAKYSIILGHQGVLLPIVAAAAAVGARRVLRYRTLTRFCRLSWRSAGRPGVVVGALGVLVLCASVESHYFFAVSRLSRNYPRATFRRRYRNRLVGEIRKLVPSQASLCATFRVASHFALREHLYLFPLEFDPAGYPGNLGGASEGPDYVLLDFADSWTHPGAVVAGRDALWHDPDRRLIYSEEGFLLYQRGKNNHQEVLNGLLPVRPQPGRELNQELGEGVLLVGTDSLVDPKHPELLRVVFYFMLLRPLDRQLFLKVDGRQGRGKMQSVYFVLANGVVPPDALPVGRIFAQTNTLEFPDSIKRVPVDIHVAGVKAIPEVDPEAVPPAIKEGLSGPSSGEPRSDQPRSAARGW